MELSIGRVAAQLSREDAGRYRLLEEIAEDAAELVRAADELRSAKAQGRRTKAILAKAERIAKVYRARVIEGDGDLGFALGIRFSSGRYSNGTDHVFPVS